MNPTAKMDTLDEIIAMMEEAEMGRIPGREPQGVKLEKQSLELDPAMGEAQPAELAEAELAADPMASDEMDMGEDDLAALMAMYGDEEDEEGII